MEIRPGEEIGLGEAREFLEAHLGRAVPEIEVAGRGGWSQAFAFGDRVVRFGQHVEDFRKDRRAARFSGEGLFVPQVFEIGEVPGGYFVISERAYGKMLDDLSAKEMRAAVPGLLRTLDAMRGGDLGATSGFGMWGEEGEGSSSRWGEFLLDVQNEGERVHGWHRKMVESPFGLGLFEEGVAWLERVVERCPEERCLVHTDLFNRNVLMDGTEVSAVIDWGNAIYGDFIYELALFVYAVPWYEAMAGIDWAGEARRHYRSLGLEVPEFELRMRVSQVHIGLSGMAYCAFAERWPDFEFHSGQVKRCLQSRLAKKQE